MPTLPAWRGLCRAGKSQAKTADPIALVEPARALVFGSLNVDLKASVQGRDWPKGNATEVGEFHSSPGGKGGNEAVQIAKLGVRAMLVGRVGNDELGEQTQNNLRCAARPSLALASAPLCLPARTHAMIDGAAHVRRLACVRHRAVNLMTKTGMVEFEDGIFSDDKLRTGVAMQLVFDKKEDGAGHTGQSQSITKVNVLCGGANLGISSGGYEVKYIESVFQNCAPPPPSTPPLPPRADARGTPAHPQHRLWPPAATSHQKRQSLHSGLPRPSAPPPPLCTPSPRRRRIPDGVQAPEVLVLQLEISVAPMLEAAQKARRKGCLVVLKPSPLVPKTMAMALQLLDHTDVAFVNEREAIALLRGVDPSIDLLQLGLTDPSCLVNAADAERVATALLARCATLHTVVVQALAGHVLCQARPRPHPSAPTPTLPRFLARASLPL